MEFIFRDNDGETIDRYTVIIEWDEEDADFPGWEANPSVLFCSKYPFHPQGVGTRTSGMSDALFEDSQDISWYDLPEQVKAFALMDAYRLDNAETAYSFMQYLKVYHNPPGTQNRDQEWSIWSFDLFQKGDKFTGERENAIEVLDTTALEHTETNLVELTDGHKINNGETAYYHMIICKMFCDTGWYKGVIDEVTLIRLIEQGVYKREI